MRSGLEPCGDNGDGSAQSSLFAGLEPCGDNGDGSAQSPFFAGLEPCGGSGDGSAQSSFFANLDPTTDRGEGFIQAPSYGSDAENDSCALVGECVSADSGGLGNHLLAVGWHEDAWDSGESTRADYRADEIDEHSDAEQLGMILSTVGTAFHGMLPAVHMVTGFEDDVHCVKGAVDENTKQLTMTTGHCDTIILHQLAEELRYSIGQIRMCEPIVGRVGSPSAGVAAGRAEDVYDDDILTRERKIYEAAVSIMGCENGVGWDDRAPSQTLRRGCQAASRKEAGDL